MPKEKNNTSERELRFSRLLDAPVKIVWDIWTKPEHINLWWGPEGFTTTVVKMDVKPGGEWNLVMHSPDGKIYKVKSVFRETEKHKKIVYEQLTQFKCVATIEFESRKDKTFIMWTMLFESKEKLIEAAKMYDVVIGLKQTAEKLITYLIAYIRSPNTKSK
jgi:uncharacterized protein YndB with AHSA1/START domain